MSKDKLSFLKKLLGTGKYSGSTKEVLFDCPFCNHHNPKLSVNIETDRWQCWVCGKAGNNLVYLIKDVKREDLLPRYLSKYAAKRVNVKKYDPKSVSFYLQFPEEFYPLVEYPNSILGKRAWDYLTKKRGISEQDILRHKIGIAEDKIVFPSFGAGGDLNFYTVRTRTGLYFPPLELPYAYKNGIILNELNIDWSSPLVLVEGFIDMYKSVTNTALLAGSYLAADSLLFRQIVKHRTPIMMALDPDTKIRKKNQKISKYNRIIKNFMQADVPVYNVEVEPYKDVGEMAKKEFKIRYENAKLVSEESMFRNRLRMLC